jgi:hypothetical protein
MANDKRDRGRRHLSRRDFVKGTSNVAAGVALGVTALGQKIRIDPQRLPRVVRVYDQNASSWDWQSNYYFDFIDQAAVNQMFFQGLQSLTGAGSVRIACERLIPSYQPGDKIAIKINLNNNSNQSNGIDATAPVLNAVLLALISGLGVPDGDIYVYDVSRAIPSFRIRSRVPYGVNYVQSGDALAQSDSGAPISFRGISTQYCPKVLTQADHLIDLPLFKDHVYVLATMGMKNHFGTTRPGPAYLHNPIHQNLSDLNATPHIRDKTRLVIADALFGVYTGGPYGEPQQWVTFPGGPNPNSIFLGIDPVATESVMIDYLLAERLHHGLAHKSHEYLHDAMDYNHLGQHEHRNAAGKYTRIEYIELDLT